jgi:hypothetical protein
MNFLNDYIELVRHTKGTELVSEQVQNNSTEEKIAYTNFMEFKFDSLKALNKILTAEKSTAISSRNKGKDVLLSIYPAKLSFLSKPAEDDTLSQYLSMFNITYKLTLHCPQKIKESDTKVVSISDNKTTEWEITVNDDWYNNPVKQLTIRY